MYPRNKKRPKKIPAENTADSGENMKHQPQSNSCQHLALASSKVGEVMICPECGVVHLSLNHVSLRFDVEAFRTLAYMLAEAQLNIESFDARLQKHQEAVNATSFDSPLGKKMH